MIERDFINQKTKEYYIRKHIESKLRGAGISQITLKKIPLGEKIIISTSRPSVIVGSKGSNIKTLTRDLKNIFKLENPQIEINEVKNLFLDANIVADRIANSLQRFGSARFKGIGHKTLGNVLEAGALGVEIIISGKIPGSRAKNWRFYQGYLKKCGDVAISGVRKAKRTALLKSGIIGIKVAIMPPNIVLPDHVEILDEPLQIIEEVKSDVKPKAGKSEKKSGAKKSAKKKKSPKTPEVVKTPEVAVVENQSKSPSESKSEKTEGVVNKVPVEASVKVPESVPVSESVDVAESVVAPKELEESKESTKESTKEKIEETTNLNEAEQ
jgi:small subunit ribosomal protein S3